MIRWALCILAAALGWAVLTEFAAKLLGLMAGAAALL